ncbi:MAG: hypothetical protein BWY80_01432 [Firmicutes bacterium ADurb.Bin456]|nr:MAG: hypothetical protein BWY80_01432 [Firmicutes bacterium ADurb.Bin456]
MRIARFRHLVAQDETQFLQSPDFKVFRQRSRFRENCVTAPVGHKISHLPAENVNSHMDAVSFHRNAVFHPLPGKTIDVLHYTTRVIITFLCRPGAGKISRAVLFGVFHRFLQRHFPCNRISAASNTGRGIVAIHVDQHAGIRVKRDTEVFRLPSGDGRLAPIQLPGHGVSQIVI